MNKKMGKIILFFIISVFAFSYEFYTLVPDHIVYINGNANNLPKFISGINDENPSGTEELKIFGVLPYKSVSVDVIEDEKVILGGESIGIDINVDGIMILGFSDFYGEDGKKHCPAKEAGLKIEDIITNVNGNKVSSASQFTNIVDANEGTEMKITFVRNSENLTVNITPIKSAEDGQYHLGLWARDGTSGIGTLTFIDPKTNRFGALGHCISDADTGDTIKLGHGNIYYSAITRIQKGARGMAGEMQGCFISSDVGEINQNSDFGIFGTYYGNMDSSKTISIASRNEIKEGEATMLCCTNGNDIEEYSIIIEKINISSYDNKSMIIRITDNRLIEKTGGIVQGMSGSPIVQNGKLVGAVTHVMVNNSCRGYAVFSELMLAKCQE